MYFASRSLVEGVSVLVWSAIAVAVTLGRRIRDAGTHCCPLDWKL